MIGALDSLRGWRRPILAAAMAVVVTVPSAIGSPAHASGKDADGWTSSTVPVTLNAVNPCNNDAVTISGGMLAKVRVTDRDGLFRYEYLSEYGNLRGHGKLLGSSDSGDRYVADGASAYVFSVSGPGQHQSLFTYAFDLKAPGARNDFQMSLTMRTTFDGDFKVTAEAVDLKTRCK